MQRIEFFISFLLALGAHAAERPYACVPQEGLSISGINLSDTRASVILKLGKPEAKSTYKSEDDGGLYTGATMSYRDIELDVNELRGIERISSIGPDAKLPFGLTRGMSSEQVAALLNFIHRSPGKDGVITLPICQIDGNEEMQLNFEADSLESVDLLQYGP